jgi:RimJ/RimL family protein N-acetyltransferase
MVTCNKRPTPERGQGGVTGLDDTNRSSKIALARNLPQLRIPSHPIANIGIVLAPEWRGKKIGTFLLAKLLKIAYIVGYHSVCADILSTNQHSISLFRKLGFRTVDVHKVFWPVRNRWVDEITVQRFLEPVDSPKGGGKE